MGCTERTAPEVLFHDAHAVLFDFDGPVTDLFGDTSTAPVAAEIKKKVLGIWGHLDPDVEACDDSHGILRRLSDMYGRPTATPWDPRVLKEAEAIVTEAEHAAVRTAVPAPHVERLVEALSQRGRRLVIVSNNADGPVREFLDKWDLRFDFVVGRDPQRLELMKPHPASVERALARVGVKEPEQAFLIGDQLTDLQAAHQAGIRFLGYTQSEERAELLRVKQANWVVKSHEPLIKAADSLIRSN
ncbi:HAD-IA family hydrolase [Streptomyces sp. WI03-4A]|uniref:HAD family hydrolase n=1 Tax=Streptomyces sp. WI03-4A TaxID=3028706 RepID=UPI0029B0A9A7|nr:HAD-IA family hydrolase [Streptomyces sp. WI03-4A]MDX2594231.1 HAD-IA family hydrolase [Streptomyces sp. WI03-4A]